MATKAPAKKVRITAKQVAAHRSTGAKRDHSPVWHGAETWSGEQFTAHFRHAMEWYRLESSAKELKPQVINWMAKNGYSKSQIQEFKRTKDSRCGTTMGAIAACLNKGMPNVHAGFNNGKDSAVWLGTEIGKVVQAGKDDIDESEVKEVKLQGPIISIQDRVRESALGMTEELEDAIESWGADAETFDPKAFKVLNLLKGKEAKAAHARIIRDHYGRWLAELNELAGGSSDEQLREGYKHRSRKHIKKIIEFLTEIESACNMLMQEAKVNKKPRKVKAVSKDKLVAKLKYKKTDEALKLVSVNPIDIIEMKELWIYNTKSRKLGKYVASEYHDLGIKGTTITGFDEIKSVCKTLRKPAEQLKEFKAAGKVALRKFLDDINAVDTKMNGRISEDIILLKVA
jgi:hypothetical protein